MAYLTPTVASHEADTSDAHAASAVSILDTAGDFTATDVEGALAELQSDAEAHLADSSDAHDASAISITDSGGYFTGTDVEAALQELGAASGGGGAPTTVDYLVGTADGGLSNEIVVGVTPGGELGGTWASPTVDATHSGTSHAGVIATHEAAGDPHTGYRLETADHSHASTGLQGGTIAYSALTSSPALCQARLVLVSATDNDLYLVPYKGNRIVWGDGAYSLTLSGYGCTITNSGLSNSTLYYVYVYSNSGVATLEISATGHTSQSNGDETKTGDASRLLVGMIYTTSGGLFQNESQYGNVISYHNRLPMFLAAPGGSATTASATFDDVATEADNLIEFLTWGYELGIANACGMGISGTASSDANNGRLDVEFGTVGLGSGAPVSSVMAVTSNAANEYQNVSGASEMGLTEGHHVFTIWARAYSSATATVLVNSFARTYG